MITRLSLLVLIVYSFGSSSMPSSSPSITVQSDFSLCAIEELNCGGLAIIAFSVTPNCPDNEQITAITLRLDINDDGQALLQLPETSLQNEGLNYVAEFEVPVGMHALQIVVENACGDQAQKNVTIEAGRDCTPPTVPNCLAVKTVVVDILDEDNDGYPDDWDYDAQVVVSVEQLLESTTPDFDLCTPSFTTYSVNRLGESPDQNNNELLFTCDDLPCSNPTYAQVNAWDDSGNRSTCITEIVLEVETGYNFSLCGYTGFGLACSTGTEYGTPLSGVVLEITNSSGQSDTLETIENYFVCAPPDIYTIIPLYEGPYDQGVTTFDLVILSQHLLGIQLLDSPYKMIAADVNGSNSITTLDLIAIRKLLLGIVDEFPNDMPSWHFVGASYVFPNPHDPWEGDGLPPWIINTQYDNVYCLDLIAVKLGDVNLDGL